MSTFEIKAGNVWSVRAVLAMPGDPAFVWTGMTIRAQLRSAPNSAGALVHTFTVVPEFPDGGARCEFTLALSKDETLTLPSCYGDFLVERASPQFGPLNIWPYQLILTRGITVTL